MDEILTDLSPPTLSRAIQGNLNAFFRLIVNIFLNFSPHILQYNKFRKNGRMSRIIFARSDQPHN
jgi:hypothetical protein